MTAGWYYLGKALILWPHENLKANPGYVTTCVNFPAGNCGYRSDAVRSEECCGERWKLASLGHHPCLSTMLLFPVTIQLTFHVQAAYHLGSAVSVGYFTHVAA